MRPSITNHKICCTVWHPSIREVVARSSRNTYLSLLFNTHSVKDKPIESSLRFRPWMSTRSFSHPPLIYLLFDVRCVIEVLIFTNMTLATLSTLFAVLSFSPSLASASLYPKVNAASLRFEIGNATQYLRGTNAYWLPFQANLEDIDSTLDHLAAGGLKIVRTWGFSDVNEIPPPGQQNFLPIRVIL